VDNPLLTHITRSEAQASRQKKNC